MEKKTCQESVAGAELEVSTRGMWRREWASLPETHGLGVDFWRRVFDLGPER